MLRSATIAIGAAALIALGAAPAARAADVTIGVELALTGMYSFAGVPGREAMEVAIDEIKEKKLAGDNTLTWHIEDEASNEQQAITLANQFILRDHALAVLGATASSETLAIAPLFNNAKIPLITPQATSDAILKTGDWVFRVPASSAIISSIARYAVEKRGVKRVAIVFARDNAGNVAQSQVAKAYFQQHGVTVVDEESVLTADSDFSTLVTKLASLNINGAFLAVGAEQAANLIIQARQAGLDPSVGIFGPPSMGTVSFLRIGGKAVEGASFVVDYYSGADTPGNRDFVQRYQARYHHLPDNSAAVAYASAQLLALAIKNAGPNPTSQGVRDAFAKLRDVPTILGDGHFSLDADRNPNYGAIVLTVKNGQFVQPQ